MPRAQKQVLLPRADGRYRCKYKGLVFYGDSSDEALAAREEYIRMERQRVIYGPTVKEYADSWLKIAKPDVSSATSRGHTLLMKKLTDVIGELFLHQVTPSQIKGIFSSKFIGLSDDYIKHARYLYTSLFDAARDDGYCDRNPVSTKSAQPHKGTSGSHRAITTQEREWIHTYCTDHKAFPAVMAMLYGGLRPAEVKALDIDKSIDTQNKTILINQFVHIKDRNNYSLDGIGKTEKAIRTIPLFPPLEEAIEGKHGLIVSLENGDLITQSAWRRLWSSYVNQMERAINGVQKRWYGKRKQDKEVEPAPWISFTVTPYDLRHSFITWCRDYGVELHTVVEWAGHSDSSMILKIYDEVSDGRSKSEAEKLIDKAFGPTDVCDYKVIDLTKQVESRSKMKEESVGFAS